MSAPSEISVTTHSPVSLVVRAFLRSEVERVEASLIRPQTLHNRALGLRWLGNVSGMGWRGGLAEVQIGQLTPGKLDRWLTRLASLPGRDGRGHGRAKAAWDAVRRLLSWSVLNELVETNPSRGVSFRYRPRQVDGIGDGQLRRMAKLLVEHREARRAAPGPRAKSRASRRIAALMSASTAALVVMATGCRVSEAASARAEDWSFELRQLTLRDSKNRRRVLAIPEQLATLLDEQASLVGRKGFLFPSPRSVEGRGALRPISVWRAIREAGDAVGLRVWPHKTRHAFARAALRRGRSPREIAQALGNTEGEVLRTYIRGEETPVVRDIVEAHGSIVFGGKVVNG